METTILRQPAERPQHHLLVTKLSTPKPRPDRVIRSRLLVHLERPAGFRLAVLVAPAGWGKSTLVTEWCARLDAAHTYVAWLSLDEADNDPARFLLYLVNAVDHACPGLGETARTILQSDHEVRIEAVLAALLNSASNAQGILAIVLDDYHAIESKDVHRLVTILLDHQPANLRIVIMTRMDPPLPISRMRAGGEIVEVRARDLRFTCEETAELLNDTLGLGLSEDVVARLDSKIEGWAAGLQLAAISLHGRPDPARFVDSLTGSHRYFMDYLADEVLSRLPEHTYAFLLETSILRRLCGPLCEAVTGQESCQTTLEELESSNLFLMPMDEERSWFRYHPLFADVLRSRLKHSRTTMDIAELHVRAADWYEKHEQVEEAVHHALAGDSVDRAANIIERHGDMLWLHRELSTLEYLLNALPDNCVKSRPVLSMHRLTAHLAHHRLHTMEPLLFDKQLELATRAHERKDLWPRVLVLRGYVAHHRGQTAKALEQASEGASLLGDELRLWRNFAVYCLGLAHLENGDLENAWDLFGEATAGHDPVADPLGAIFATLAKGRLLLEKGRLGDAEQLYRSLLSSIRERLVGLSYAGLVHMGLATIHYHRNEVVAARDQLMAGIDAGHPTVAELCRVDLLLVLEALGDKRGMEEILSGFAASAEDHPWLSTIAPALRARCLTGKDPALAAWLSQYDPQARLDKAFRPPIHNAFDIELMAWSHGCLSAGITERAVPTLWSLVTRFEAQGKHGIATQVRPILAAMMSLAGNTDQAIECLVPALSVASGERYLRAFLNVGRPLVPVLQHVVARGIQADFASEVLGLIREGGGRSPGRDAYHDTLAEQPSTREIEVLRLVAAGLTNAEIAEHLYLSPGTVKRHVHNLYRKLDVSNRIEATNRAREIGLI